LVGDIANIATAVAVLIAAGGLWAQTRARKFELALVYVQQYWKIQEAFLIEGRGTHVTPNEQRYLRLCEDEFDAARQGWIDVSVWRIWHDGMRCEVKSRDLDASDYDQLQSCTEQNDHEATKCPGLGQPGLRRRVSWSIERILGS